MKRPDCTDFGPAMPIGETRGSTTAPVHHSGLDRGEPETIGERTAPVRVVHARPVHDGGWPSEEARDERRVRHRRKIEDHDRYRQKNRTACG